MPTTYNDQFWLMDPYAPPPAGTLLTVNYFSVIDQDNNNFIGRSGKDSIDGSDIRASYPGDQVTVQLSNGSTVTITGSTFYLADGRIVFTPIDGSTLPTATLVKTSWVSGEKPISVNSLGPPCFTPGTLISTPAGQRKVEALKRGDLVLTADRGAGKVVFVHARRLSMAHLEAMPEHCPVRIKAGALGHGLPARDLVVSPQHRILIRSAVAERMFGETEILVPACQLVGFAGIRREAPANDVKYLHILLDHHAVLFAEGAGAESLYLGTQVHENLLPREIDAIRARLSGAEGMKMKPARLFVRGRRLRALLERHVRNGKPLCAPATTAAWPALRVVQTA